MLELQQIFGSLIPDVEFVIATSDRPAVLLSSPGPHLPVFRFCSSDAHADIQVPIFHFTTKRYTQMMLQAIPELNSRYPCESCTVAALMTTPALAEPASAVLGKA